MTLPTFLIIGAQKSGTTWLANMLGSHPQVFMPPMEIHFFNLEQNYRKGIGWYERFFEGADNRTAIGEKTPNYFWTTEKTFAGRGGTHLPRVHKALHKTLPDARLIVVLRDPVDRAISAVNHYVRYGELPPGCDIDGLLVGRERHLAEAYGVIDMGCYHRHLSAYLGAFPKHQILVLFFEEHVHKAGAPDVGLSKSCEFLGIDANFEFVDRNQTKGEYEAKSYRIARLSHRFPALRRSLRSFEQKAPSVLRMPAERVLGPLMDKLVPSTGTREQLREFYRAENEKLAQLIGRVPDSWRA